jgi:superfamily II DNA or RNA helicase
MKKSLNGHYVRQLRTCRSWTELTAVAADLPNTKAVGDLFELLTKLTLQSAPEYRTHLSEVWSLSEVPRKTAVQLDLPRTDEGIDLIAKTKTGEFWAIQCKYRSASDAALGVRELSTFSNLAFQHCKGISHGLIAHTSNKPIRKKNLLGSVSELGLSHWASMDEEAWKAIHALLSNKPIKVKKRKPRPHQRKAIAAAEQYFKKAARGKMIMPCGSGKSLTAFWIAERLAAKTVVVAVPSLALIKQSIQDWTREYLAYGVQPEWLAVCSDDTVGDVSKDEFVSSVYELGIDATTDRSEIAQFLTRHSRGVPRIIFTSYQSGPVLSEAVLDSRKKIDLLILDEAHKTVGDKEKRFSTLLADANLPARKRLFMTATERVLAGSDKKERVYSMDDAKVYGEVFYQVTFKQAIEQGLISDYRILTVSISREEVDALIEKNALLKDVSEKDKEYEAVALTAGIALNRTFEKQGVKHAISFHRSIKAAEDFAAQQDMLARIGVVDDDIVNGSISSRKSAGERDQQIREFVASDRALLSNARCLTEGVDIPSIDCVCFASPKQSVIDIVQASGRAMRTYEGKDFGYILLPIVIPEEMDFEEFADTTEFKTVARTIAALSIHDERIVEYFRLIQEGKRLSGRIIEIEGSEKLGQKIDLNEFSDAIETKLWKQIGRVNWRPFDEARAFAHDLGLQSAAEWRAICKSGQLPGDIPSSPNQIYKNDGWIGFGDWCGTGNLSSWDHEYRPFKEARKFVRSLGLKSGQEWIAFYQSRQRPNDIPSNPRAVYKNQGWVSMGDWLGTGAIATRYREFLEFVQARDFAQSLGLNSKDDWLEFAKSDSRPVDIPLKPERTYQNNGWKGWGDWLGTGRVANFDKKYRSFDKARQFAQSRGLKSQVGWFAFCKSGDLPADIPANPSQTYKDKGWIGIGDWLGTGRVAAQDRKFRSFDRARKFSRALGLKSGNEWRNFCRSGRLPADIPANPNQTYKNNGWKGMGDWLGSGTTASQDRIYRSFSKARKFVRSRGLKSQHEWREFCKSGDLPADIPANPSQTYKDKGWIGIGDWLGTGVIAPRYRKYRSFKAARKFVRTLGLQSGFEWEQFCKSGKKPEDIPAGAGRTYKDKGWAGMGDWLGTGTIAPGDRKYRPFKQARKFVRRLGLSSTAGWQEFCRSNQMPEDIPSNPGRIYKDKGWVGMGDWLGTGTIAPNKREYRSFTEARIFARGLGLKNQSEWRKFVKSGKLPDDIPAKPDNGYKNDGWVGIGDWLGTGRVANFNRSFRSFKEARKFARSLGLKSSLEWSSYSKSGKRPDDIPSAPNRTYQDQGWINWKDWLGTK